jgi:tetratricopeptide (TPR) repeat protein
MFNDDSWDNDEGAGSSMDELLIEYNRIKNGAAGRFLDAEEYEAIIEYYYQNNSEAEALTACDIAQTYHPFSTEIGFLKAEILFQAQKYGQALKALDALDAIDQNMHEAVLLRSDIYMAQQKLDMAVHLLEEKANAFEAHEKIEILHELVDVYDECEDFDAVFKTLKRILETDIRNEEALHKICFWADFAGMNEESRVLHQEIVDQDPYNALAWFNLGAAYQGLRKYEDAIDAYEYCVAIDEKFESAYRNMADAYMRLRWYDKAIESLEKNLELGKPEDVIFEAMGHCFEKQKNFDRARHYYRQAIQLNPADDMIFFRIGETYAREHQWEKAIKAYSAALHLNRESAAYCMAIGNCLMELNAGADALVCYLNAVQLKPSSKTTWVALIKGLYQNGYHDDALAQLELARTNCGSKPDFDYLQALVLFALGKSKEAILFFESGLSQAPAKLKSMIALNPELLQRKSVADIVARYKRKK